MTPCELCDAQGPARRPHKRVWSLGCEVDQSGIPAGDELLKLDPSIGKFSSWAWFGNQNKHSYQKFDVEMGGTITLFHMHTLTFTTAMHVTRAVA